MLGEEGAILIYVDFWYHIRRILVQNSGLITEEDRKTAQNTDPAQTPIIIPYNS